MLEEPIITATPPLSACDGRTGGPLRGPLTGTHARRGLHGVLNLHTGERLVRITGEGVQETPQVFLTMIRSHGRGWHIVRFEDRGSPQLAAVSRYVARPRQIERRFWPEATPELNAVDHLWRMSKDMDWPIDLPGPSMSPPTGPAGTSLT
jgi:hypothetical protein